MLFAFLHGLSVLLPIVERVQLVGCKHDFDIGHGGGLLVAVLVGGLASGGKSGNLVRGVVRGGDGVQGGEVKPGGFVADDLIVRHGKYFLSLFVVVLPGGAGWMGSGRFTVRPVKVSGGGQSSVQSLQNRASITRSSVKSSGVPLASITRFTRL